MQNAAAKIEKIGARLVGCDLNCPGIRNEPAKGVIPRGLIFESRKPTGKSCIVVGLNPGKCNSRERTHLKSHGLTYQSFRAYFDEPFGPQKRMLKNVPYFKKARNFITDELKFDGNILWTNLAKCECKGRNGIVPIQTLRVCINRFLRSEIATLDCETIVALGNQAFDFCALSFPDRLVIGIAHPAAYGPFYKMAQKMRRGQFKQHVLDMIWRKRKDESGHLRAIKIPELKAR